jgi:ribonuclease HI
VVKIFTDGGFSGNPGPGGWGFVIVQDDGGVAPKILLQGSGSVVLTTNNRMELNAVISALEALPRFVQPGTGETVEITTDSQYVKKGQTEWLGAWKRKGWRTASGSPVKNVDMWQQLDALASGYGTQLVWRWVKGHSGDPFNELCDALTQEEIAKIR